MSDVPFYRTRMGHDFFTRDLPALLHELRTLNAHLARLNALPGSPQGPPTALSATGENR